MVGRRTATRAGSGEPLDERRRDGHLSRLSAMTPQESNVRFALTLPIPPMTSRLSRLLRGKHHHVWEQFALDVGGTFAAGGSDAQDTVAMAVHGRQVVLEGDVTMILAGKVFMPVVSTRFVTELPSVPGYRFSMTPSDFSTTIARWFGAQDIAAGEPVFDDAFVLRGVEPDFVRQLFADGELRALCLQGVSGRLQRRDDTELWSDPTPGKDPLELSVLGLVDDLSALHRYFDVFTRVLARMPDVG
jgi:hypothetical protein